MELKKIRLLNSLDDICIDKKNVQINTINAHSYNVARKDKEFAKVLQNSDYLLPDGQSIVLARKILNKEQLIRIAGFDLFQWEMRRIDEISGKCFFFGSTNQTLEKIKKRTNKEYPNIQIQVYSPPYKQPFSKEENQQMIGAINEFKPNVLFVGMTAPKQEKWVSENIGKLNAGHICSIGAVFDFYAGTVRRAPKWMQNNGLEWFYRLIKEPKRMWKRYILGNTKFIYYIIKEKYSSSNT